MYTLKSIATRGTALGAAFALVAAAVIPGAVALAAELNPLTERSLLLSSSAPGYIDTDGSNYSTGNPNPAAAGSGGTIPASYAPAGSGPNGKKTGETFTFKVTSQDTIYGMSFQYCTNAAGDCVAPGNNTGDSDPSNDGNEGEAGDGADTPTRETNTAAHPNSRSDLDIVGSFTEGGSTPAAGEFVVLKNGAPTTDWAMSSVNAENDDLDNSVAKTGKKNMIHLINTGSGVALQGADQLQVVFKASESTYITNPGDDEFFVKINTYDTADTAEFTSTVPANTPNTHIVDGGVTVANVMTDSIHITTKVLETMSFSVGNENPDSTNLANHGTCDTINQLNNNRLNLGNQSAEYSLETNEAYDTYSFWRLSSNSSGGASVYYSGNTLANTVGDEIADMPCEAVSDPGTEQFGLGFVDAGADGEGTGIFQTGWVNSRSYPFKTLATQTGVGFEDYDALNPQTASQNYDEASGSLSDGNGGAGTAKFSFHKSSLTVPELIAQQNDDVISCATAKMRYVGNIGADTPAGVYTTRINYLAAPQY